MRVLLTGASGQVGSALVALLRAHDVVAPSRGELDLADASQIRERVRAVRPDVIVNAGAYTAVDRAEQEPETARRVNGIAPGVLAEEARRLGVAILHFSTDYVFDGTKTTPYAEDDATGPLSVYGTTKLEGEDAVRGSGAIHLVLRTSWVYSRMGRNFLLTIERLAREKPRLTIVADQRGTPNWAVALARATMRLVEQPRDALARHSGVYHLSSQGETTWHGFAGAIVAGMHLEHPPDVAAITTSEYPTPARRPAYAVLSPSRLASVFGITLPQWDVALRECQESK